jgi:hypothetical protein
MINVGAKDEKKGAAVEPHNQQQQEVIEDDFLSKRCKCLQYYDENEIEYDENDADAGCCCCHFHHHQEDDEDENSSEGDWEEDDEDTPSSSKSSCHSSSKEEEKLEEGEDCIDSDDDDEGPVLENGRVSTCIWCKTARTRLLREGDQKLILVCTRCKQPQPGRVWKIASPTYVLNLARGPCTLTWID